MDNRKNNALKSLGQNTQYTKALHKNNYDSVSANTFPVQNHNLMIDTLILPTTLKGFNRLLVVVGLWSKEIEFGPMIATDNTYDPKTGHRTNKRNGLISEKMFRSVFGNNKTRYYQIKRFNNN